MRLAVLVGRDERALGLKAKLKIVICTTLRCSSTAAVVLAAAAASAAGIGMCIAAADICFTPRCDGRRPRRPPSTEAPAIAATPLRSRRMPGTASLETTCHCFSFAGKVNGATMPEQRSYAVS